MALTPGARLGPYEILSALGAGGMGEVYRASDTRLKRQVAVKILPSSLATDVVVAALRLPTEEAWISLGNRRTLALAIRIRTVVSSGGMFCRT